MKLTKKDVEIIKVRLLMDKLVVYGLLAIVAVVLELMCGKAYF
jgi:hypothetical protein